MQCRPKEKIFAWPTRWPARFSPPSSLRRPSIWRGTANPRGLRHLQSSCDTEQRCSVRQPDNTALSTISLRASIPFEIDPWDSSSVIFASARREPRGISARPSITRIPPLLILHNTTTELGGKTLSVFSTCVQPFYGMVGGVGRR